MRFLPRFIYSSGIILRGARGDKYRTVTFRNSLATRDAGSAGGVNRGAGEPPGPGPSAGPASASPAPRGHVVPATGPAVRRTANPLERVPARPGRRRAPSGATGTRAPSAPAPETDSTEYEDRPRRTAPSSVVSLFVLYTHYGGRYPRSRRSWSSAASSPKVETITATTGHRPA